MGQLLRGFLKDGDCDFICVNPQNQQSLVINFVNAQPTDLEKETYNEAEEFLKDTEKYVENLKTFKGRHIHKSI